MKKFCYIDSNAITILWDTYTKIKQKGQTGDDITKSPFNNVVLSEYVIDEITTIPINNVYKKHVALLLIFPDIPVFSSIANFTKEELDQAKVDDILKHQDFLRNVAQKRAMALTDDRHLKDLEQDIKNKENGKITAEIFIETDHLGRSIYTNPENRINISEAISKITKDQKLKPTQSPYDFYVLCMHLYVATRNRLINVPAKMRKGRKFMLNHQIDFYHLSYLPFIDEFVTNDEYLSLVAKELVDYFKLSKRIYSSKEFLNNFTGEN